MSSSLSLWFRRQPVRRKLTTAVLSIVARDAAPPDFGRGNVNGFVRVLPRGDDQDRQRHPRKEHHNCDGEHGNHRPVDSGGRASRDHSGPFECWVKGLEYSHSMRCPRASKQLVRL